MACLFEVVFDAASYRNATDVAVAALEQVALLEAQLTVYRDSSEVMHLNRSAADGPVAVEQGLYQLLKRGADLATLTGGAFDITAGALSKIWGFYRRQGRMPSPQEVEQARATVGSQYLEFLDHGPDGPTIRFLRRGLELNLGAIGKGYALDRAAEILLAGGIYDFLLHGGNSSVLARGRRHPAVTQPPMDVARGSAAAFGEQALQVDTRQEDTSTNPLAAASGAPGNPATCQNNSERDLTDGWLVGLRHPLRPEKRLAEFLLRDQALGTSGSGTQFFHYQGKRYGHILDPRTGWPADKVLSATVIAPTAELADALSTACYVMGVDGTRALCEQMPQVQALLTVPGRTAGQLELIPINLSEGTWRPVHDETY